MTQVEQMKAAILAIFEADATQQLNVSEISERIGVAGSQGFKDLVKVLAELEGDKTLNMDDAGKFRLPASNRLVEGVFHANDRGFGFVSIVDKEPNDPDIFIAPPNTNFAMNGDTVEVAIIKEAEENSRRGPEGKVAKVITRGIEEIVGEFMPYSDIQKGKTGWIGYIQSHAKKLSNYRIYLTDNGLHPQKGDMVQVDVTGYPSVEAPGQMLGIAKQVLGNKNDPGVDVLSIVYQHDIKTDFPEEVRLQSEAIPDTVLESDKLGRKDLTDQDVVTIDGDDSKDFDDAVNVKKLANGNYYLGVHIADVSYYVTEGSPLDVEALERGTSTYLTDRVIPMLPFRLSNGICSLNPDVERLALTCEMEINEHGVVVDHKIFPSVIKSTARMTYKNVNKILTDQDADLRVQYERLVPMFETMSELHAILLKKRHNRGAIDFEEDEAKIIVDENGKAIDIELRQRGLSERMIESFMLAANETVAEHYSTANAPFLYRIHETPDADKMKNFFEFITAYGIQAHGSSKKVTPMMLQEVLTQIEGQPEQPIITTMLLRSMQQAHYSDESLGHFGLGAEFYTHFTSPIRRYPDLMVHRLIHSYATNGMTIEEKEKWAPKLQPIAEQTSLEERRSIDTEREVVDLKKAEYMLDKVGNEYDAVISSVTSFGMFIALPSTVEGLVHISQMKDDYYSFVESQLALVGERTHKMFRIGQPVRVKVANVDLDAHSVDFELLAGEEVPLASAEILSKIEARPKRPARPRDHEKGGQRRGDQKKNNHPRRPAANKDSQKRTFKK